MKKAKNRRLSKSTVVKDSKYFVFRNMAYMKLKVVTEDDDYFYVETIGKKYFNKGRISKDKLFKRVKNNRSSFSVGGIAGRFKIINNDIFSYFKIYSFSKFIAKHLNVRYLEDYIVDFNSMKNVSVVRGGNHRYSSDRSLYKSMVKNGVSLYIDINQEFMHNLFFTREIGNDRGRKEITINSSLQGVYKDKIIFNIMAHETKNGVISVYVNVKEKIFSNMTQKVAYEENIARSIVSQLAKDKDVRIVNLKSIKIYN